LSRARTITTPIQQAVSVRIDQSVFSLHAKQFDYRKRALFFKLKRYS
jgi:hypothetical protein